MSRHQTTNKIYGNCQVLSPKGVLMFLCGEKKMNWYLENNLAEVVDDQGSPAIKLTFKPNGSGHAGKFFYLMPRENKCVVCGTPKNLTRHHVVPQCYRKHFPVSLKKGVSHDVLAVCNKCHADIEREYDLLKVELSKSYDAPLNGIGLVYDQDLDHAQKALKTLVWYGDVIPPMRFDILTDRVEQYLGCSIDDLPRSAIQEFLDAPVSWKEPWFKTHGQMIIEQLDDDYEWFVCMWRAYFLEHMKPKHMPQGWSIEHGFATAGHT